jgi:hypothetical protein
LVGKTSTLGLSQADLFVARRNPIT